MFGVLRAYDEGVSHAGGERGRSETNTMTPSPGAMAPVWGVSVAWPELVRYIDLERSSAFPSYSSVRSTGTVEVLTT
jgi:hypothetical protein